MKIDIIEEKQNPLLHRKELVLAIGGFGATLKKDEVLKEVSSRVGGAVVLGSFRDAFGRKEIKCAAKVYESEEFKNKYEPKPKEKKAAAQASGEKKA